MTVTYRCQYVRCCKPRCKTCPHGPYWYGFWKEGGRTKSRYYGKADPRREAPQHGSEASVMDRWRAIFDRKSATLELAREIMELPELHGQEDAQKAFCKLSLKYHPDRQGNVELMQMLNAAWSFIRSWHRWK